VCISGSFSLGVSHYYSQEFHSCLNFAFVCLSVCPYLHFK
jgi:hypothetical protein